VEGDGSVGYDYEASVFDVDVPRKTALAEEVGAYALLLSSGAAVVITWVSECFRSVEPTDAEVILEPEVAVACLFPLTVRTFAAAGERDYYVITWLDAGHFGTDGLDYAGAFVAHYAGEHVWHGGLFGEDYVCVADTCCFYFDVDFVVAHGGVEFEGLELEWGSWAFDDDCLGSHFERLLRLESC